MLDTITSKMQGAGLRTTKPDEETPAASGDASNQDMIRGSIDVPLDAKGVKEAIEVGRQFGKKGGVDRIIASDLSRAVHTAQAISHFTGVPVETTHTLHPWHLGGFEGQPTNQVLDTIHKYAQRMPDVPVPGRSPQGQFDGESFNQFKFRTLGPGSAVAEALAIMKQQPKLRQVLTTHLRDLKLIHSWVDKGAPDDLSINNKLMVSAGDKPASVHRLYYGEDGKLQIASVNMAKSGKLPGGTYIVRHGSTAFNH